MRRRPSALGFLLVLAIAPAAAAEVFKPGTGLAGLETGATGIYELGTVTLANATVDLRALLHNGQVLQVQSRHDGRWLARRSGSMGGKAVAPTKLDELTAIAGGLNVDVRRMQPEKQQQFARTAGLVLLEPTTSTAKSPPTGQQGPAPGNGKTTRKVVTECAPASCRVIANHDRSGATGFTIALDNAASVWSFTGYGIVAVWPVPQAAPLP